MQQNITFIRQFIERLRSESPKFFKVLQWTFSILLLVLIIVNSLISTHTWEIGVSAQKWVNWLNGGIGSTIGGLIVAGLTTTNPTLMDDKTKVKVVADALVSSPEIIDAAQMQAVDNVQDKIKNNS